MKRSLFVALAALLIVSLGGPPTLAQAPDALPYAQRGASPVGVVDLVVEDEARPLPVTMWYPALNPQGAEEAITYQLNGLETPGQALREAAPDLAGGPYPVIYYSHGLFGARLNVTYYLEHLASWGFVVLAVDHPGSTFYDTTSAEDIIRSFGYRPLEIQRLIAFSEALNTSESYAGLLDLDALAMTGYSFGGYTSLLAGGARLSTEALAESCARGTTDDNLLCEDSGRALVAEALGLEAVPESLWPVVADARLQALTLMAPCCVDYLGAEGLAGVTAPLMVFGGTQDGVAPPEVNAAFAFEAASSTDKTLILLQGAGHDVYPDSYAGPLTRVHDLIKHLTTAFFLSHLKGDAAATAALDPAAVDFAGIEYMVGAD